MTDIRRAPTDEKGRLPDEEYIAVQNRVELLSRLILDTDPRTLATFIEQAERADTLGPFMDPTAWVQSRDALKMVIRHARALAAARKEISGAATDAGITLERIGMVEA